MGKRITAVLQDHDAVLEWLSRRMQNADSADFEFIQREFVQCLGTHVLAIDKVLKPVLVQCGAAVHLADWFAATNALNAELAEALPLQSDPVRFREALSRLSNRVAHLREHEGERLASLLTTCLSDGELKLLGADVQLFLSHRVNMNEGDQAQLP